MSQPISREASTTMDLIAMIRAAGDSGRARFTRGDAVLDVVSYASTAGYMYRQGGAAGVWAGVGTVRELAEAMNDGQGPWRVAEAEPPHHTK